MEPIAFHLLVALVGVALLFDFLNGLHDAANSIATIVSTRVLRPQYAVAWAAFFNFIAFLVFSTHVARTIGTGIVDASIVDPAVIFGALTGAIVWNVVTWIAGIPSSSSHALVGGVTAALLWELARHVLVWYFTTLSKVNVVYGSMSTAIVVMFSLEIAATLLLFGAQVIAEYERVALKGPGGEPVPLRTAPGS